MIYLMRWAYLPPAAVKINILRIYAESHFNAGFR